MPSPTRITLPPSGRPVGGLLSAARSIGGDWWRGVSFSSSQCTPPFCIGPCPDGTVQKDVNFLSDPAVFDAFQVYQSVQCSRLGGSLVAEFSNQSLDVTREFAVAREFLTGACTGNPSLADALTIGAATDPATALGCLEQYAALAISGRMVFVHVPPSVATALLAASAIWRDGRLWRTASGNVVVVSPGYDGRAPGGVVPVPGGPMFMYATGDVYAEVGQRDLLESLDRTNNVQSATAEDAALVIFDPCFNIAIDSGVNACA